MFGGGSGYDIGMKDLKFDITKPGLFVTATDTAVGKTVVSCAIAHALREKYPQKRIAGFKPLASECDWVEGQYVNPDTAGLHHFTGKLHSLETINPVRFVPPLAPGVAAEVTGQEVEWGKVTGAMREIDQSSDMVIAEGAGGLFVPLDPKDARCNVLELAAAIGYPVLIVARATLGTLNHTTMTIRMLEQRGCKIAGVVLNNYQGDYVADDPSVELNKEWLHRMTDVPVIATIPAANAEDVKPNEGKIDSSILEYAKTIAWEDYFGEPKPID